MWVCLINLFIYKHTHTHKHEHVKYIKKEWRIFSLTLTQLNTTVDSNKVYKYFAEYLLYFCVCVFICIIVDGKILVIQTIYRTGTRIDRRHEINYNNNNSLAWHDIRGNSHIYRYRFSVSYVMWKFLYLAYNLY